MSLTVTRAHAPDGFNPFDIDFFVDGLPVGKSPSFRRTALTDDLLFTDAQTELNILVTALRLGGVVPAYISKRERPDFEVRVVPNDTFYVEITTVIEPMEARADTRIVEYSQAIGKWAYETAAIKERTRDLAVTFFLPFPPKASAEPRLMEELRNFLSSQPLHEYLEKPIIAVPDGFPLLTELGTKVLILAAKTSFVQVSRGAMAVSPPIVGARQVISAVERKAALANSWSTRPLWLVLWLTAMYSWPKKILDELEGSYQPDLDQLPFDKVIVGDGHSVLMYHAE